MSWEGAPHFRWVKMFQGQRYRVRCEELGLAAHHWTKEASYQAANEWWEKKLADLSGPDPLQAAYDSSLGSVSLEEMQRTIAEAELYQAVLFQKRNHPPRDQLAPESIDGILALGLDLDPEELETGSLSPDRRFELLGKVGNMIGKPAAPMTYQLKANSKRFLELERAKNRKPRTYGELSESIEAIITTKYKGNAILYPEMDVRKIDKTTVENFYLFLRVESKREPGQQKKQFGFFKRLVRHLFTAELIDLPRNLDNKWDFNVVAKKVKEYDKAEILALLKALPDRLKLYALLGLNCGMLSVDVGSLRKDEIDMKVGRIKRKRTKTENEKDVPEVDYLLWPITFKLLKKCLSADPHLALTTKNGKPLVTFWIDEKGKKKEKNMVRQQWKRAQTEIPHKAFRTIGATVIGSKADGGKVAYYLGHSPKSIQDKHYKAPDRDQFDEIVTWLGQHFKLVK